jgi:hypothetical protein
MGMMDGRTSHTFELEELGRFIAQQVLRNCWKSVRSQQRILRFTREELGSGRMFQRS